MSTSIMSMLMMILLEELEEVRPGRRVVVFVLNVVDDLVESRRLGEGHRSTAFSVEECCSVSSWDDRQGGWTWTTRRARSV
jgi:hypothetical protein